MWHLCSISIVFLVFWFPAKVEYHHVLLNVTYFKKKYKKRKKKLAFAVEEKTSIRHEKYFPENLADSSV